MKEATTAAGTNAAELNPEAQTVWIDGRPPLSVTMVDAVNAACDKAEDGHAAPRLIIRASGVPGVSRTHGVTISLVSKWERALRRLERLPMPSIAIAEGPCGGLALDVLLSADYRIADEAASLSISLDNGATWPGMALYRLGRSHAGAAAVRRAVLFGSLIGARQALELQLIDVLTDDVESALATAVEATASVRGSELAIRRQLLFDAANISFEEALGAHLAACDRALLK
ncbi:enoyl-CoA-hydratase DpgB, partial [Streptomyces sp. 2MCAF27]